MAICGVALLPLFCKLFVWESLFISMRNLVVVVRFIAMVALSGLLSVGSSIAEETEMDMDLMQTIEDTNDSLSSNVALEEGEAAIADAKILNELFGVVEDHYIKEVAAGGDFAEAVDLSSKSKKLTADIIDQLNAGDFESAANSATDLARTCKTCHNFYKED